ncbi:MAG TPA: hypothetical protein ENG47_02515 [Candidatus Aerophobetes bacterium]|uniref:DUF5317 domain-containing protein n=1 Tax=Aerophobetes bacterium TaxID=2030807 RepID=A0A662DF74_UNCAE|nr:MAG: hypothetical protein DRI96_03740 [Candidatus Aerophobetes bacterium]HDN84618.1 hypothetical protein [Candidatus Aerophobetes bacterium]
MLLDVLIVSVIIAFLRGGRFKRLAEIDLKRAELIVISFGIQYILVRAGESGSIWVQKWGVYLYVFSYILLLVSIWYNRHIKEMLVFGLGIITNFTVIVANGGHMPVSLEALKKAGMAYLLPLLQSKTYIIHTLMNPKTRLKFLADIIPLPPPYPRPRVLSVGDIIMGIGVFFLIQNYMTEKGLFKNFWRRKDDGYGFPAKKDEREKSI